MNVYGHQRQGILYCAVQNAPGIIDLLFDGQEYYFLRQNIHLHLRGDQDDWDRNWSRLQGAVQM